MLTLISYRFAHLLVPLQDIRHGVVVGELHVAVEDDALAENSRDVNGIVCKTRVSYNTVRSLKIAPKPPQSHLECCALVHLLRQVPETRWPPGRVLPLIWSCVLAYGCIGD